MTSTPSRCSVSAAAPVPLFRPPLLLALLLALHPAIAQDKPAWGAEAAPRPAGHVYIVQLAEPPVVAYEGGIGNFLATRPATGRKLNPTEQNARRFKAHLRARHDAVLAQAGGARKLYSYTIAFNGFAAELTAEQVTRLQRTPGVVAVTPDRVYRSTTPISPKFMGLSARGGLWAQAGGNKQAGENIVIGVIDSGIWPEHPSFSDRGADGQPSYAPLTGWYGICQEGQQFTAAHCNGKLVGARFYGGSSQPGEFASARDYNGHGTHVAATAGGTGGVPISGVDAAMGSITGIAPRARIAAYKVLWAEGYGLTSDVVAAVDQAVEDGVDVINASLSIEFEKPTDPLQLAFLRASAAGIFVAAAGGNDGPYNAVANPGPWNTTVAASTRSSPVGAPMPPEIAGFSSRGPWWGAGAPTGAALVKPDLAAPGVNIVAAMSPAGQGISFSTLSGTSMATPHVAGLAAILKQLRPTWSPAAIKSALMTTAYDQTGQRGSDSEVIAYQGSGQVRPNNAADPGLVFDAGLDDWRAWLCGIGSGAVDSAAGCTALQTAGRSLVPADLNGASIALREMTGPQTLTRRVTNVSTRTATYTASVDSPEGLEVTVSPASFTLAPGSSQTLAVTVGPGTAPARVLGARGSRDDYSTPPHSGFTGARIVLQGSTGHVVRVPVIAAFKPAMTAPTQVASGYNVGFSYTGAFSARTRGLVPAVTQLGTVAAGAPVRFRVQVPAGSSLARFALLGAAVSPANVDLDMWLYTPEGVLLAKVDQYGSNEQIDLTGPRAANGGEFDVEVRAYNLVAGATASFTLFTWVLGDADAGNLVVSAPGAATAGTTGAITLTPQGLAPATRYLGAVVYGGSARLPPPTIVRIDTP